MSRILIVFLLLASPAFADDPPAPTPVMDIPTIVAPKGVTGMGTRDDPFRFDAGTKCVLMLTGDPKDIAWDKDDVPPDFEEITPLVCVFSCAKAGEYQTCAHGGSVYSKKWFVIKSGTDPPKPEDSITSRVKAALAGHAEDAAVFGKVCDGMATALEAGSIQKLSKMESSLKASLDVMKWVPGRYPDLSKLAGELWGAGVPDRDLTADDKAAFAKQLKMISAACAAVK